MSLSRSMRPQQERHVMTRNATALFHPGHSLSFQEGKAARHGLPNRSIVDLGWTIRVDRGDHGTEATKGQNEESKHRMASNGRSRRISHPDHGLGACITGLITGDSFTPSVYQCRRIVPA